MIILPTYNFSTRPLFKKSTKFIVTFFVFASILFTLCVPNVLAAVRSVGLKLTDGFAFISMESTSPTPLQEIEFTSIPANCQVSQNKTDGSYYSYLIKQESQNFTLVKYPIDHLAQIVGDNKNGKYSQNDLESIQSDFYFADSNDSLTIDILSTHSVLVWPEEDGYFVALNTNWPDYESMLLVLQNVH